MKVSQAPFLTHRPFCFQCRRSVAICFCTQLRPFETPQDWVILIHPRETRKAIGTGRMTHQSLPGSKLLEGVEFDQDARLQAILSDPNRECYLVFPGAGAVSPSALKPSGKQLTFILLDGTWSHARTMIGQSPKTLGRLPRVAFQPLRPSGYRIRKQPSVECFSTLEAVHTLIDLCDAADIAPAPVGRPHDHLLVLFEKLVSIQERFELKPRSFQQPREK